MSSYTLNLTNPLTDGYGRPVWHKKPTMQASGSVTFTRNSDRDTTIYFSGSCSSNILSGYYGYAITAAVCLNGNIIQEVTVATNGYGTGYFSGSFWNDGTGNIQVYIFCNGGSWHNCNSSAGNFSQELLGEFPASYLPYNPEVPATNITGGAVYNQNGVQNGDDKPDWEFYVDWWGESAGTHSITQYNLDIYKSTDLNTIAATVDRVSKWTRYNFERYLPKCKVGETYYFYINVLVDNSYWLGRVMIGSIKLFKDGIVWVKRYDNGAKVEATMAYSKYYQDGSKKKVRYIFVKDYATGAQKIIDMYTTHYE